MSVPELTDILKAYRDAVGKQAHTDIEAARVSVELVTSLRDAGRVSSQEYVFMVAYAVECINDERSMSGSYDEALTAINDRIDAIRNEHGLDEDEYFLTDEAPPEYLELVRQCDEIFDQKFAETLREAGATELAELFCSNRSEFYRARERGRRALFHRDEIAPAVYDIVGRYEREASIAANAGAYTAAITLMGAALEGLLLLRCLRSKKKAKAVASALPKSRRPKAIDRVERWTFDNLVEVCEVAGWLPAISTRLADYSSSGLAHQLRILRNFVHPGRVAQDRPWIESDEREYALAAAIFETLRQTLSGARGKRNLAAASLGLLDDQQLTALGLERREL